MNAEQAKIVMARNIKHYMSCKGVTNQQICADLGLKYTTFLDWINGKTYPRIGKVEAMAEYFGIQKSDLIENKLSDTENDALSAEKKQLIAFVHDMPEEQVALASRLLHSISEQSNDEK